MSDLRTVDEINSFIKTIERIKQNHDLTVLENKALSISIMTLEKAKPKQPIIARVGIKTVWFCPSCGARIKSSNNYCCQCGSRVRYDECLKND